MIPIEYSTVGKLRCRTMRTGTVSRRRDELFVISDYVRRFIHVVDIAVVLAARKPLDGAYPKVNGVLAGPGVFLPNMPGQPGRIILDTHNP